MMACLRPDLVSQETASAKPSSNAMNMRSVNSRRARHIEDRENFEKERLQKRTGGFYQYVDSAEILRPNPVSTHFIDETERFNKDFNTNDQVKRALTYNKNQDKIHNLRKERLDREQNRFGKIEKHLQY